MKGPPRSFLVFQVSAVPLEPDRVVILSGIHTLISRMCSFLTTICRPFCCCTPSLVVCWGFPAMQAQSRYRGKGCMGDHGGILGTARRQDEPSKSNGFWELLVSGYIIYLVFVLFHLFIWLTTKKAKTPTNLGWACLSDSVSQKNERPNRFLVNPRCSARPRSSAAARCGTALGGRGAHAAPAGHS